MSKRIAFCADGTWDNSGKNTNVYKLFKALHNREQMKFPTMTMESARMDYRLTN